MKNQFLLTSAHLASPVMNQAYKGDCFFLCAEASSLAKFGKIKIIIDGYVVPRNAIYETYKQYSQHELIFQLYMNHGNELSGYIKGFFCIVIIEANNCLIINDIHSVKRCYIARKDQEWFITNNLFCLEDFFHFRFDRLSPAILAVLQHFTHGKTMFEGVEYSPPGSFVLVDKNGVGIRKYYDPEKLVHSSRNKTNKDEFIDIFRTTISNSINYLSPQKISSTLTGGRDTRSILAALLSLDVKPHCFTFGFPTGSDVKTAKNVANSINLDFYNHYIHELSSDSYDSLVKEIVSFNNPAIHLHRAHRLDAIKKENCVMGGDLDMVFVGAMGGDYIKGEKFNDYILTEFLRRYLTESTPKRKILKDIFDKHYVIYNHDTIEYVFSFLQSIGLAHNNFNKEIEFNLVYNIIGCTHDIQDISMFMEHCRYVIAPFMDIDVMEALFTSPMSMFSNDRHSKNPIKLLKGGELQCCLIKALAPSLADIPFANQYTPNDLLGNKILYVTKRIYRHAFKIRSAQTFSYDNWFFPFVEKEINRLPMELTELYDTQRMVRDFQEKSHQTHEGYWHKFTNPITLSMYHAHNIG